jgi:HEAT repeat protein
MTSTPAPPASALLIAAGGVLASIALAYRVARLASRGARHLARESARRLEGLLRGFLEEGSGAHELRRAAREADHGALWAALESLAPGPGPAKRRRLGDLLERNRHALAERRALRDDSPWRRELAARRLGLVSSPGSRRALRRAMQRGPESVTLAAALALARLRDRPALRWVLERPETLAHRMPRALAALLRGFGRPGLALMADALERGVADPRLTRALIETLGASGWHAAAGAIERCLAAENVDVRVAAARALGRLGGAARAPALIARLADPEWPVRAQAARALGLTGATDAVGPLAACLTDRAWWVRRHAAYALLALGEAGGSALRAAASASPDPYARDIAGEALGGGFPRSAA